MADNDSLFFPEHRNELHHVRNPVGECVICNTVRGLGLPETSHVRGDGVKPCFCKRHQLMPPGVPTFWKAVAEQHQRPWPDSAMWKRSPFSDTSRCVNSCVLSLSAAAKLTPRVALLAKTPVDAISAGAAIEPAIPPRTARRLHEVRFEE
jgi:hypothetical protein